MGKLIVISAPSGTGKTSIVHFLLKNIPSLAFSISACSREKRKNETNAKDYYFIGVEEFKTKIQEGAFLEWEEVYKNQFYGTLNSELDRIFSLGKNVIFDIDVIGGLNIKKKYLENCLAIFIMPPSIDALRQRLNIRNSESKESLKIRIDNAELEISKNKYFDAVILNDKFNIACQEAGDVVKNFINS